MKNFVKILVAFLFVFFFPLMTLPTFLQGAVSDTWANTPKKIGGTFKGAWSETPMTGPGNDGKDTVTFFLVPGAQYQFKFLADPDKDGNYDYEPSFSTSSGNRELTVVDDGSGSMTVDANWADTPLAPSGVQALPDSGSVLLSWTAPASPAGLDVQYGGYYEIYMDTGDSGPGWVLIASETSSSYRVTGLRNDTTYYFYLRSVDAYGMKSDSSNIVSAQPRQWTNVTFRIYVGQMDDSQVYVGVDTNGWTEIPLSQESGTDVWSGTVPFPSGTFLKYKYVIEDSNGNKTFEYPFSGSRKHMFIYPSSDTITQVQVSGSWDGWAAKTNLTEDTDGYWRTEISINAGQYEYKFILNGSSWVTDPFNDETRNGNSLLAIEAAPTSSGMREVNVDDTALIFYDNWEETPPTPGGFIANPFAQTTVHLRWERLTVVEDVDSYYIEYTESPQDPNSWIKLVEVDGQFDSYYHTNLIPGDVYYYRLYTIDYQGVRSPLPNFDSASPGQDIDVYIRAREEERPQRSKTSLFSEKKKS